MENAKTAVKLILFGVGCALFVLGLWLANPSRVSLPEKKEAIEEPKPPPAPLTKEQRERAAKVANELTAELRRELVETQEHVALKNGIDAHITATGLGNKIYKFEFILMSRPFVYQLVNEKDLLTNLRSHGFTKAIFTDGRGSSWTYDLTKP